MKPEPRELQLLREADQALVEATTFDEIIGIQDNVAKIKAYDTTIELSDAIILQAGAFRVKALRKMGQLLKSTNLAKGGPGKQQFLDHGQRSWLEVEWISHSSKPEAIREIIEKVSPGPFLEMYGRSPSPNARWTTYGNQLKTAKE